MLGVDADKFEPAGLSTLLTAHEAATGKVHSWSSLCDEKSVQQKLSTERHAALFDHLDSPFAQPATRLLDAACKRLAPCSANSGTWPQSTI